MVKNKLTDEERELFEEFLSYLYYDFSNQFVSDKTYSYVFLDKDIYKEGYDKKIPITSVKRIIKDYSYRDERKNSINNILNQLLEQIENQTEEEHLFFTPNTFIYGTDKTKKNKKKARRYKNFVKGSSCFFVDIDGLDMKKLNLDSKEKVEQYLIDTYPFLNKYGFFPSYVVTGKGGLHLYFIFQSIIFTKYTKTVWCDISKKLIKLFNGDKQLNGDCSRHLRTPFSINYKDKENPVRTVLYGFLDDYDDEDYDDEEVYTDVNLSYFDDYVAYINNLYYSLFPYDLDQIQEELNKPNKTKPKQKKAQNEPNTEELDNNTTDAYEYLLTDERRSILEKYNFVKSRKLDNLCYNRVNFIVHYLIPFRNKNNTLKGNRNKIIFVITKLYLGILKEYDETLEYCLTVNNTFKKPLSKKEIIDIVFYCYQDKITVLGNNQKFLKLSNKTIKEFLDITPEEQDLNINVVFYDELQKYKDYYRKKRDRLYKQYSLEPSTMDIKYMKYFQTLEQNPQATNKELAELMDLKLRQVYNIKNKYKEHLESIKKRA